MSYTLKLVTGATTPVVSTADMKLHLRVDNTTEDTLIATLVTAATRLSEAQTRRAFLSQVWEMYLDCFPADDVYIALPRSPIITLDSIKYQDEDDAQQTFADSNYKMDDITSAPPRISLKKDSSWPDTIDELGVVVIRFTAGYGTAATSVPAEAIAAIKLIVGNLFENRENVSVGAAANEIPWTARTLLDAIALPEAPIEP